MLLSLSVFFSTTPLSATPFNINFSLTGFSTDQTSLFTQAEDYWEGIIHDYIAPNMNIPLDISAELTSIDGENGTLGNARVTAGARTGGFVYSTSGEMNFDLDDFGTGASSLLYTTIVHEVAHLIGFGSLWELNNLYEEGSYEYTGAHALEAYRTEFNAPDATYVPVEDDGGAGTAESHWERDVFGNYILTGFISEDTRLALSQTSLGAFRDLGYVVTPEPGGMILLGFGMMGLFYGVRKKRLK